ncbi:MAG: hypothetical protein [Caudoviricetes sp.]|nr:MAG: hypothetical protein [Caudoviricetes sp.]
MRSEFDNAFLEHMRLHRNESKKEIANWVFAYCQTEVDELQRRNKMLNDNVKEQGQKLVYQNGVIEKQAEKLLGLRDEKAELQKRMEALIQKYKDEDRELKLIDKWEQSQIYGLVASELEQALNGGGNEK